MSGPNDGERELYLRGSCHVMATALHRAFGWSFLVVTDADELYWVDPTDPDNFIPAVVHVYATTPDGLAWDVLGSRPVDEVISELVERHPDVAHFATDEVATFEGLATYVDGMGQADVDRPLHSIEDEDVAAALEIALQLYAERLPTILPGFSAS